MPGIILNPIANYGGIRGQQPEPPYVPTYEGIYFAGQDQYYYSGSDLYPDVNRIGGMNRTLFEFSGSIPATGDGWSTTINSAGASNTPIKVVAGGSLREYTIQSWYIESGSIQYKHLQTTNKGKTGTATLPAIIYSDTFSDTSGDILGIETALDESYAILYGQEFLRTSNTHTATGGLCKLSYDLITSSYAGDSTFETNVGQGANNQTIGGAPGIINKVHINKDKKIGVGHNGDGWNGVSGSYHNFVVLNNDGTRDTTFQMASGSFTDQFGSQIANGGVNAVYYFDNPADGKKRWIVGGTFRQFGGTTYNRIIAFDETGSLDTSFNTGIGTGFNSKVTNIFKIDDDFMGVVGQFNQYDGTTAYGVAVLRYDGALLNALPYHDGNEIFDGVYYDNYLYLRGDFKEIIPAGGSFTFVNGIISMPTSFSTFNPNYFIGTGSLTSDTGYCDINTSGSSQPAQVFLG